MTLTPFEERMVTVSVQLIQAGRRTIDEVPENIRQAVQDQLNAANQP